MLPIWEIETAGEGWSVQAPTWQQAVRRAFRDKPPKTVGVLVRFMKRKQKKKESFESYQNRWSYVSGEECCRLAGFPVSDGPHEKQA